MFYERHERRDRHVHGFIGMGIPQFFKVLDVQGVGFAQERLRFSREGNSAGFQELCEDLNTVELLFGFVGGMKDKASGLAVSTVKVIYERFRLPALSFAQTLIVDTVLSSAAPCVGTLTSQ